MKEKITQTSFENQDVYIGIDSHLKSWKVTVISGGVVFKTFSMDPKAQILAQYLRKHFPGANYYSAYEASYCGFSIHRALEKYGINNIIVNPADIPTTDKERQQKEDKRDSKKIARSLSNNELTAIHIPDPHLVEFRALVRYRKTLAKEISRNKCRIKSILYFYGISIPPELDGASKYWSGRFTSWLRTLEFLTEDGQHILHSLLDITEYTRMKLLQANREIRKAFRQGAYSEILKLLCCIPGIGVIVAATLVAELDTIKRFKSLDKLSSYVGLVPRTNSSGEQERVGGITKRSNKPLRSVIIESAWVAIRIDPALGLSFLNLSKRMKKNEAIIRIAKKLLNRIRYVLLNEVAYEYAVTK